MSHLPVPSICPQPWPATDGLGRELPLSDEVGPHRPDRFVGIFYFLWLGAHDTPGADGPFDVSRIIAETPDALEHNSSPPWGPEGGHHYWGEPLFGYYRSTDPWVIRRHAHLLAAAGVDTLIFDTTNRVTYNDAYTAVCRVFSDVRAEGWPTPAITFMCNTKAGETAQELYNDLYRPGHFSDLWFRWDEKPLLICDPDEVSDALRGFFTFRKAHWPFELVNTVNAWHWEATYPQPFSHNGDESAPEQVNVSIAQNLRQSDGKVAPMSSGLARGRNFHNGCLDTRPHAINDGLNAAEQWDRALDLDPPFVMITGWNEWTAGRYTSPNIPVMFVDQFDQQNSRDIEMAKGHHLDHYYWQMVANIRRYKGAAPLPQASESISIDIDGPFAQWDAVGPAFTDPTGETRTRDHAGVYALHYENRSGRNEILCTKLARDETFLYAFAETAAPLSPHTDLQWMMLFLSVDGDTDTGWQGFEFVVNRTVLSATETQLERCCDDGEWGPVCTCRLRSEGRRMHLAIPRDALGLVPDAPLRIDLKWVDNMGAPDPMQWYVAGDTAPLGRFRYRYQTDAR